MKPRNKYEAGILTFSQALVKSKKLTAQQEKWSKKVCHDAYYTPHYKDVVCLECNTKFRPDPDVKIRYTPSSKADDVKCPCCKNKLKHAGQHIFGYPNLFQSTSFFAIYDVFEGYQVERIFVTYKYMKKGEKPRYIISEVVQRWISETGRLTTIAKKRNNFQYYDSFQLNSELEIRAYTEASANHIYPDIKLIPILQRNGLNLELFEGYKPHTAIVEIIKNPFFEHLLKIGQFDVALMYLIKDYKRARIERYRNQLRICSKNGYYISKAKDVNDYFDYLDLLVHFEKDINNPKFLCPENLKESHDYWVDKKRKKDAKEQAIDRAKEERAYIRKKKKYFNFSIEEGDIKITVPQSIEDFFYAGDKLKHCIATNRYYNKETIILFAEVKGEIMETAEVHPKKKDIIQCRGYRNEPTEYNEQIVSLIKNNIHHLLKPTQKAIAN